MKTSQPDSSTSQLPVQEAGSAGPPDPPSVARRLWVSLCLWLLAAIGSSYLMLVMDMEIEDLHHAAAREAYEYSLESVRLKAPPRQEERGTAQDVQDDGDTAGNVVKGANPQAKDARQFSLQVKLRAYLQTPHMSLSSLYRTVRIAVLGLFAISLANILLLLMKLAGFNVLTIQDFLKTVFSKDTATSNASHGFGAILVSALIAGTTTTTTLVPELMRQASVAIDEARQGVDTPAPPEKVEDGQAPSSTDELRLQATLDAIQLRLDAIEMRTRNVAPRVADLIVRVGKLEETPTGSQGNPVRSVAVTEVGAAMQPLLEELRRDFAVSMTEHGEKYAKPTQIAVQEMQIAFARNVVSISDCLQGLIAYNRQLEADTWMLTVPWKSRKAKRLDLLTSHCEFFDEHRVPTVTRGSAVAVEGG